LSDHAPASAAPIGELEAAAKAFAATRPYRAVLVPDVNPVNRRFVFESVDDVPLAIRVRAGEIVHHTRAALDLLVYQLLMRAGAKDERRLRSCAFPVVAVHDPADRKQANAYENKMERTIAGVTDVTRERIEALQPGGPGITGPGRTSHKSRN
jgi:hypothetical protein